MNVRVAAVARAPAGHGGVGEAVSRGGRSLMRGAGIGHVDGGGIDEQGAGTRGGQQILVGRQHVRALGQHGDHHIGGAGSRGARLGQRHTGLGGGVPGLLGEIESRHGVSGLGEIDRHR